MISVLFSFRAGHNDCVSDGVSRVDEGGGLLKLGWGCWCRQNFIVMGALLLTIF